VFDYCLVIVSWCLVICYQVYNTIDEMSNDLFGSQYVGKSKFRKILVHNSFRINMLHF